MPQNRTEYYLNPKCAREVFSETREFFGKCMKERPTNEQKNKLEELAGELCCFLYPPYRDNRKGCKNDFIKELWDEIFDLRYEIIDYLNIQEAKAKI